MTSEPPGNHRILVIDDNPAIHDDFRKILSEPDALSLAADRLFGRQESNPSNSFVLDSAYQGEEGLAMIRRALTEKSPYEMAFIDVRMPPGWDGVETTKRISEVDSDLQVVICTAYSDYPWSQLRQTVGHPERLLILKKPFDPVEVMQLAHALTEKWRLQQVSSLKLVDLEKLVQERTREIEDSRVAALNMMEDAVAARLRTEQANEALQAEISERKQAEEKYHAIFNNVSEGIFQSTPAGRFLSANPAMARILGYGSAEELIRERTDIARQGYVDPAKREEFKRLAEAQGVITSFEYEACRKDGGRIWVSENVRTVRDARGQTLYFEGTLEDITERKRLEEQFRQAQKMEAVGQLAGGVAHDFNNMLAVMRGNAELLLLDAGRLPGSAKDGLKQIVGAAERAANLTRQLLTFSRRQVIQTQPLLLNDAVANVAKMLKRLIREDIHLEYQYATGLPWVQADIGMIEQVLVNLVVNARDAMPRGGKLSISTEKICFEEGFARVNPHIRPGEFVCLKVSDTGTGIDPEVLPRIFEPFFTTKEVSKGTGLGLATVYGIVKQHQGWIDVATHVGQGTTFSIFLPAIAAPAAKSDGPKVPEPLRGGSETILLVEDDHAVRLMARRVLESLGYKVIEATSGREGREIWRQNRTEIALLLSDIVMPEGVSGRDLAEELRTEKPALKVILMSGYSADLEGKDISACQRPGCRFLQKPFSSSTLISAVRQCLDGKSAK